ncbi:hypothetical protein [Thalassoglobus polymorphus]|nr:hypothetical protein [Thalassoglobus polymorphus]
MSITFFGLMFSADTAPGESPGEVYGHPTCSDITANQSSICS